MERVVVALGGNALLRRGADDTFEEMYAAARGAAERIADVAALGYEVVITHGNGPQVGRILLQQEAAAGPGEYGCDGVILIAECKHAQCSCTRSPR